VILGNRAGNRANCHMKSQTSRCT